MAQAIDAISANSDHETKSQTESAFQQAFIKQFADIGMIVYLDHGCRVLHLATAHRQHHGPGRA